MAQTSDVSYGSWHRSSNAEILDLTNCKLSHANIRQAYAAPLSLLHCFGLCCCVISSLAANSCWSCSLLIIPLSLPDIIQNILWSWAESGIDGTFLEVQTYVHSVRTGMLCLFALAIFHESLLRWMCTGNWHRKLPFLEGDIVRLMRTVGVLELNPTDTMWNLISRAMGGPQKMTITK